MVRYEINEHIPACHVNKDFLNQLEDYIKSKIPNLVGISKKVLFEKYSITISDGKGEEEINSISNYTSNLFPDSIKDIEIMVLTYGEKHFRLNMEFSKDDIGLSFHNHIQISYESKKAREVVLGIYEGIKRIIEPYKNHNEFYHPSIEETIPFTPAAAALFFYFSLLMFSEKNVVFFIIFLFIGFLLLTYITIGRYFKPYITFETNYYFRVQKSYSTFKAILITIIVAIFIAYMSGVWS